MPRPLLPAALIAASLAIAACGGSSGDNAAPATPAATPAASAAPAEGQANTVTIKAFNFQPDPITVKAGTTITFVNSDQIHHTATAGTREKPTPDVFNAELDAAPDAGSTTKASITLDEPGTYDYFCTFHPGPGMTAKIIVE